MGPMDPSDDLLNWYHPFIHEIRPTPDVLHPASTPKEPIVAAYTIVLGIRQKQLADSFITREYGIWRKGNPRRCPRLALARRAETNAFEGDPAVTDTFIEFNKDALRFDKMAPRPGHGIPDWSEIGAAATAFEGPLYAPPLRTNTAAKRRLLPKEYLANTLQEWNLAICNLRKKDGSARCLLVHAEGDNPPRPLATLYIRAWQSDPINSEADASILALPASGVDWRLAHYLRKFGDDPYKSVFPLDSLFSEAGINALRVERMVKARGRRAPLKRRLKWIAKWNARPEGKGPFETYESRIRAFHALGIPYSMFTLAVHPDAVPKDILQNLLTKVSPGTSISDVTPNGVASRASKPRVLKPRKKPEFHFQFFGVLDRERNCGIVFEGRMRFGVLSAAVATRLEKEGDEAEEENRKMNKAGAPVAVSFIRTRQETRIMLSDISRPVPGGGERPMQIEDFLSGPWIETPPV